MSEAGTRFARNKVCEDAAARKLGLKGEERHRYIINHAGLSPQMDRSQLNRLLRVRDL